MYHLYKAAIVFYSAFIIWILYQGTKIGFVQLCGLIAAKYQLNANWLCSGDQYILCLRKCFSVYKEFGTADVFSSVQRAEEHGHRFCRSRAFIKQRGIGNRQTG